MYIVYTFVFMSNKIVSYLIIAIILSLIEFDFWIVKLIFTDKSYRDAGSRELALLINSSLMNMFQ